MKTTRTLLMLLVMGVVLCSTSQVFAEDAPEDEIPEMHDGMGQAVLTIQTTPVTEEPEPEGDEPAE